MTVQKFGSQDGLQLSPKNSFIEMNVELRDEDCDIRILNTLSNAIAERKPFIKAEVYKHTNPVQREKLYPLFAEHHYAIHRTHIETRYRGQVLGKSDRMRWRRFDIFCTPGASSVRSRIS